MKTLAEIKKNYQVGKKFLSKEEFEVSFGVIPQDSLAEIIAIDNSDDEMPYKVYFEDLSHDNPNYIEDGNWIWMSEEEIKESLVEV